MHDRDALSEPGEVEPEGATALVGRDAETAVLAQLVGQSARGGALVVRGEPGAGKSTLLAVAQGRAATRGMRELRVTGVPAEAGFAYAGLYALLRPVLGGSDRLEEAHAAALAGAFGRADARPADPFTIALATLALLTHAADGNPLLLVVDDAHWLDRETFAVVAFVARRLVAERIVLLLAVGDGGERDLDVSGLPALSLEGLDDAAASQLLAQRAPDLSSALRARLIEQAAGNPLALTEQAAALSGYAGDGPMPTALELPLGDRLTRIFAHALAGLPDSTGTLLLLAACDDKARLAELLAAGESMGETPATMMAAISPAVDAGLVVVDGDLLRFGRPLLRSAVYQRAGIAARQAAHAAMAQATRADPIRSAWQRAATVIGQDAVAAAALHGAAVSARSQGRMTEAFGAFERAAWLTDDAGARARSLLAAAGVSFELGWPDTGHRLVRAADAVDPPGDERGLAACARRMLTGDAGGEAAIDDLLTYARGGVDRSVARRMVFRAAINSMWGEPDEQTRSEVASAARDLALDRDDPALLAITALVGSPDERSAVYETLRRIPADGADGPDAGFALALAAIATGRDASAERFLAHAVDGFRSQSRAGLLTQALTLRAWVMIGLSRLEAAAADAEEAAALAASTAQPLWGARAVAASALLAGMRGELATVEACAEAADREAVPCRAAAAIADVLVARGHAALAQGSNEEAARLFSRLFGGRDQVGTAAQRLTAIGDFAESAVRGGVDVLARGALDDLRRDLPGAMTEDHCEYARAAALLAGDDEAEERFSAALELSRVGSPFARARVQLAFGSWLRRQRRVIESREPLESAAAAFEALGAAPWALRARQELRATGIRCKRLSSSPLELTPQEILIAQMAASGLSNNQIGQRLYLSPRTIGSHLYRIFPKLGIASRGELHHVLAEDALAVAV